MNLHRIRQALHSDIETIRHIYLSTVKWMSDNHFNQWRYTDIELLFELFKISEFYVYEYKTEILGFIIISKKDIANNWKNFSSKNSLYLYKLVIEREHSKKGYAKELLDFAKKYGFSHGFKQLCLLCLKRKTKLIKFYLENDFFCIHEAVIPSEKEPSIFLVHNISGVE